MSDFFDDDEDDVADRPRRSAAPPDSEPIPAAGGHGGGPPTRQQIRVRQAVLAVGAILMLVLIVIAFRGCLNARSDRAFENYVSDLSSITAETQQLSESLFRTLRGEGTSSDIGLAGEVSGDVGVMQSLLDRAEGLDAPDEVAGAQEQIVLSYELRTDALEGIAAQVDKLGGTEKGDAVDAIYTQMKVLSASDILFARARDQIEQALTDEEIVVPDGVPDSQFIPTPGENNEPDYLDPEAVESAFTGAAGGGSGPVSDSECQGDGETHGLGLVDGGSTLQPSGTVLTDGGAVTAAQGDDSIDVQVQNQGTADESGIDVTVSSDDGSIDSTETISTIAAGDTETVSIPLGATPEAGESLTLNVLATPVGCEEIEDNNEASYPVTF